MDKYIRLFFIRAHRNRFDFLLIRKKIEFIYLVLLIQANKIVERYFTICFVCTHRIIAGYKSDIG